MKWNGKVVRRIFLIKLYYITIQGDRAQQNFLFKIAHASTACPSATPSHPSEGKHMLHNLSL